MKLILLLTLLFFIITPFQSCKDKKYSEKESVIEINFDKNILNQLSEKNKNNDSIYKNDIRSLSSAQDFNFIAVNLTGDGIDRMSKWVDANPSTLLVNTTSVRFELDPGINRKVTALAVVDDGTGSGSETDYSMYWGETGLFEGKSGEQSIAVEIDPTTRETFTAIPLFAKTYSQNGSIASGDISYRLSYNDFYIPKYYTTDSYGYFAGAFSHDYPYLTDILVNDLAVITDGNFNYTPTVGELDYVISGSNYTIRVYTINELTGYKAAFAYFGHTMPLNWENLDEDGDGISNIDAIDAGINPFDGSFITNIVTDVTPPTVGTDITFTTVTQTSLTATWGIATDDESDSTELEYKLVKALTSSDIDTVSEANAITGSDILMDWTTNTLTANVTGLTTGTMYYFAVLVRDKVGNVALYNPQAQATTDVTAPTVGTSITFSSITETTLTATWGAATDNLTSQSNLQYKLVKASTSAAIDTVSEVDAITGANLIMDFTTNTLTSPVTGLSAGTTYYFAVLVKDASGNKALYLPQSQLTSDTTGPVVGTSITFSSITETTLTASFGAATDNVTAQNNLQYKLVKALTYSSIDTIPEVDAITGADLIMDWSTNTLTSGVSGLTAGTTYYFAVLVKDLSGNKSLYTPQSQVTSDTTSPTIGTGITFSSVTETTLTASWGIASDNVTAANNLQYKLVKASTSAAIDTVSEVDAITGADLIMGWTANTLTSPVTGLSAGTTYYFAVLVKDASGNKSIYTPQAQLTSDTTGPVVGASITFSSVTETTLTVSFGAATDNVTAQNNLQYKLVKALTYSSIDTIPEVDAITGADLIMDWSTNTLTSGVSGLTAGTTYYFAVLVKDLSGNKSLYTPQSQVTSDTTSPTIGTGITFSSVTETTLTATWGIASDNVTAPENLQYKLVKASNSAAIDTISEVDAITGANLIMDWTTNTLTSPVTSLSAGTTYYFAVLVKDASGNKSIYTPQSQLTIDTTAPTPGTNISFSSITTTSMTVSWGAATDNVTAQGSLQYKLVKASTAAAIDTVAEADAITGGNLILNWATNTLTSSVTGLTTGTMYYFAVLVKDASGNINIYTPQGQNTTDVTAPTIGTGLTFSGVTETTTTVSWGIATDNLTSQTSLQYKLVKASTSTAIDTVAEVDAITGANLLMDWATNTLTYGVTGLSAGTTYYYAVIVKDAAGNKSIYTPLSQTTSDTTAPVVGTGITFSSVAGTSLSVNWGAATDNVTAQASLQYLVYRSASNNLTSVSATETNGTAVGSYTANITTKSVTGLTSATTYYFAVIVKDASSNKSLYTSQSQGTLDVTVPTISNYTLSYSGVGDTQITVSWTAATDNVTAQANLQYKLVKATSSTPIDTTSEVNALTGADVIMDWTPNTLTATATGLTISTNYYFAVAVKDAAGNMNLYTVSAQNTTDVTTPTPGGSGALSVSTKTTTTITLAWTAATDNVTTASSLQYLVYRSASNNISNATDAVANGTAVGSYTANLTSKQVTGLVTGTTYYFNVLVKDATNNVAAYTSFSATPLGSGSTYYVSSTTGNDSSNSGTDSTSPLASLSMVLNSSLPTGGIIRIAQGSYTLSSTFTRTSDFKIYGGYNPADWNTRAPETYVAQISGSASPFFSLSSGITSATEIDGLKLAQNTSADPAYLIQISGTATPIINQNVLQSTTANNTGNQIILSVSSTSPVTISKNKVENMANTNRYTYALLLSGANHKVFNNILSQSFGGWNQNNTVSISDNSPILRNNVIIAGSGSNDCTSGNPPCPSQAIKVSAGSPTIENNIMYSTWSGAYGILNLTGTTLTSIKNNNIFDMNIYRAGGSGGTTYDLAGLNALTGSSGNISFDMVNGTNTYFVNETSDWHLNSGGSGDFLTVKTGGLDGAATFGFTTDKDGTTRTGDGSIGWSMGAYEKDD